MNKHIPPMILGKLGVSEILYLLIIFILGFSIIYFQVSGVDNPPKIKIISSVKDSNIIIKVVDGSIPKYDWQYIIYNVDMNPPVIWTQSNSPLTTGKEIILASNLPPGTYKIIIMHKPTQKIIYEAVVEVGK